MQRFYAYFVHYKVQNSYLLMQILFGIFGFKRISSLSGFAVQRNR